MKRFALLAVIAACTPDIAAGTYYCGDEEACPPGLACDGPTATCVYPRDQQPFVCPDGTNDAEPDDDVASALDIGSAGCTALPFQDDGCIDAADDTDHVAFVTPSDCDGNLDVKVRYSVAFAPVVVDLLAADGTLVVSGSECVPADTTAQVTACLHATVEPSTPYVLKVRLADDAPTCDGACAFNSYQLSIL